MVGSMGWTSWGWATWTGDGKFRVWKHYTGPLVAVHEDYQGDALVLLSYLNDTLEDEAGVERKPTEAEKAQQQRDAQELQAFQDIKATAIRLEAENAELRRQLDEERRGQTPGILDKAGP
jgi:hypothetical protein